MKIFRKGEGVKYTPPGHDLSVHSLKLFNPSVGCRNYDIHITTFSPGSSMDEEVHPDSDHIFHILEGELSIYQNNKFIEKLGQGDTVRIPAGEYHRVSNNGQFDGVFFVITTPLIK